MRALVRFTIVALLLCVSAPVSAGPFEDVLAAAQVGDYATVLRLLRPLADQGNATAQNNLGRMYENGQGVPQDYAAAVSWYRKAADQGHADAQNLLGLMYENGRGVRRDYVQAHKWYNLAASNSHPASYSVSREWVVSNRDRVATQMTPAQIAEAQKLAREWKPK